MKPASGRTRRPPCAICSHRAQPRDKEFLVYEDERATYEAFTRAALAIADELHEQGVKKGDRVALIMRNLPEWPALLRRRDRRRDRHAAERLVDGAGAGIRPGRFRRQGRVRRRRAAGAHRRASRQLPGSEDASMSAATPRSCRNPIVHRLEDVIGHGQRLGQAARPAAARRRRSSPRTTRRSSTPRARRESRRARSAPTAT